MTHEEVMEQVDTLVTEILRDVSGVGALRYYADQILALIPDIEERIQRIKSKYDAIYLKGVEEAKKQERERIIRYLELHNKRCETGIKNGKRWFTHNDGIWLDNKAWQALKGETDDKEA